MRQTEAGKVRERPLQTGTRNREGRKVRCCLLHDSTEGCLFTSARRLTPPHPSLPFPQGRYMSWALISMCHQSSEGVSDGSPRMEGCLMQACQSRHPSPAPGAKIHILCQRLVQHPELASTGVQFVYFLPETGRPSFRAWRGETQQCSIFPGNRLGAGSQDKLQEGKERRIEKGCINHDFLACFLPLLNMPFLLRPHPRFSRQNHFE